MSKEQDALYHLHGITLQGVYDLQVAYTLVHQTPDDPVLKGMLHALRQPGIVESDQLAEVLHRTELCKQEMRVLGSHRMFLRRPVPNYILEYCALDVIFLFNMFALWGGVSPTAAAEAGLRVQNVTLSASASSCIMARSGAVPSSSRS